ncbi:hypothetical protein [Pantoea sp. BAV 3049]|uniref:hypothetical protein n=1 Tax=Pantoea sp. BAV 3049 TaxID=2654188 RepID=UPI00131A6530|nr:hypothetical protein [Pantoea sp. BAV 3049]
MEAKRVPVAFKILTGGVVFVLFFLLFRPSNPMTAAEYEFWNTTANSFGDPDVEGFIGLALLITDAIFTLLSYQLIIRMLEKRMNKKPD